MHEAARAADRHVTLTLDPDRLNSFTDRAELLRLLLDLADATRVLTRHGRDVAIAAPWALPRSWWLFAAAVHAVADATIMFARLDSDAPWRGLAAVLGCRELHEFADLRRVLVTATDDERRLAHLCE